MDLVFFLFWLRQPTFRPCLLSSYQFSHHQYYNVNHYILIGFPLAPVSRKRRDVDYSIELKWDHHTNEDPVEYAHMYRYIRARREAAEQQNNSCSQPPCLGTQLNLINKIMNEIRNENEWK